MARPRRYPARPHNQGAASSHPYLRRDHRPPHARASSCCPRCCDPSLSAQPENQHANFNVDVKVQNTPARLFALMHETISSHPNWETLLAPRILLGLWHPSFLGPAKEQLPYCRRSYIGNSPAIARKYFWNDCEVFSVSFAALTSGDGQRFVFS